MPKRGRRPKNYAKKFGKLQKGGAVAIWAWLHLRGSRPVDSEEDTVTTISLKNAHQEGEFRKWENHAEARWLSTHGREHFVEKLEGADGNNIVQIEFDLSRYPCPPKGQNSHPMDLKTCRGNAFPEIRAICTQALRDQGRTKMYIFLDDETKKPFTFDHYLEVLPDGTVTEIPAPVDP